ncbi:hypothetical protein HMPREF9092_0791 [Eubacterium sulci ATCC 35585]|nr:hypothetical protein HMPREF9092_0791 [Eubacterium sulci ATCC 35585]
MASPTPKIFFFNILLPHFLKNFAIFPFKRKSISILIPLRIIIFHNFHLLLLNVILHIIDNNCDYNTYMFLLRPNRKSYIRKHLKHLQYHLQFSYLALFFLFLFGLYLFLISQFFYLIYVVITLMVFYILQFYSSLFSLLHLVNYSLPYLL